MVKSLFLFILIFPVCSYSYSQKESKEVTDGLGVTAAANYTFSGIGVILDVEWQNKDHIFYTGPKFPISKTYLPFRGSYAWNLGYRHDYNKTPDKNISFFFNIDYQIGLSKAYSAIEKSKKMNHIHELFLGYGVQLKISERIYLANVLGVGGYLESYYNADLDFRRSFGGYNSLFKFFLNYKL